MTHTHIHTHTHKHKDSLLEYIIQPMRASRKINVYEYIVCMPSPPVTAVVQDRACVEKDARV